LVGPDWTPTEFGALDEFTNARRALGAERDGSSWTPVHTHGRLALLIEG
jgi:hypothetical protein